jgi:phosphoglycerate dehydrogenase-like enzyme
MAQESFAGDRRLAAVARFGVGYDNVDLAACNDNGVAAIITPDGVRRPVAVSVITFILALSQKLLIKDRLTRQGPPGWAKRVDHMGVGLIGKTLGQLGMGNIGAEVFRMAAPFGMKFIAHDPYIDKAKAAELGVEVVSSDELFRRADFLSVSVPLSDATRHYVNAARLKLMKPTAYLINTARGPIVDQKALYQALTDGTIAGAGLDDLQARQRDRHAAFALLDG